MLWLNPRAGKVKRVLCSSWLPECGPVLPERDFPRWSRKKKFAFSQIQERMISLVIYKPFIDQAYPVKIGYWARSFLLIITIIAFVSFHKNAQKNLPIIISSHLDPTLSQ